MRKFTLITISLLFAALWAEQSQSLKSLMLELEKLGDEYNYVNYYLEDINYYGESIYVQKQSLKQAESISLLTTLYEGIEYLFILGSDDKQAGVDVSVLPLSSLNGEVSEQIDGSGSFAFTVPQTGTYNLNASLLASSSETEAVEVSWLLLNEYY